jgi:hypothetical protein
MRFEVSPDDVENAEAALREAGFTIESVRSGTVAILKSTGSPNPDGHAQTAVHRAAFDALKARGIDYRLANSGVVMGGGEPGFAWVEVTLDGDPTNLKIGATSDAEADAELDRIAAERGIDRDRLNIKPPGGWAGYGIARESEH